MKNKIDAGDIVMIRSDSRFYDRGFNNPKEICGIVTRHYKSLSLGIYVRWENGASNSYNEGDLDVVFKYTKDSEQLRDMIYANIIHGNCGEKHEPDF